MPPRPAIECVQVAKTESFVLRLPSFSLLSKLLDLSLQPLYKVPKLDELSISGFVILLAMVGSFFLPLNV